MLRKLIKHEFIAISKSLIPIMAILGVICLSTLSVFTFKYEGKFLKEIPYFVAGIYFISIICALITIFILVVARFYKTVAASEGYLTFTLPVTSLQILLSKFVVGVIAMLSSIAFVVLSIFMVMQARYSIIPNIDFRMIEQELSKFTDRSLNTIILLVVLGIVVSVASGIMFWYTSIAIGQRLMSNKIAGAAIGYIILYAGTQVVSLIFLLGFSILENEPGINTYIYGVIFSFVITIIMFVISNYQLKKHLNLN